MRRQTDSIASANVELLIPAAHHLGSVRPLLRGHRSRSGWPSALGLLSPKVVEQLEYVMGIVRERAWFRSHHAV